MDFLNSVDFYSTDKKSSRVRSWYLYEQFKSLERNQLEAAQKLKDRSYQERILHREITERRARRKLYYQSGTCDTQSEREKSIKSEETKKISISTDDVFESFYELQDDHSDSTEQNVDEDDDYSQDGSQPDKGCTDDFKSTSGCKDEQSCNEDTNSVIENFADSAKSFADEIKEELEFVKKNIAENITLQLETVEGSLQCLEEYSEMCNDDKVSESETYNSNADSETEKVVVRKDSTTYVNNMIAMWSKLVSFAYQIIKLNHGNCYNDYGSHFLTAVLACDVLRRGINRMCHILQPYVSPIKFATDDSDSSNGGKNNNRNRRLLTKKSRNKYKVQRVNGDARVMTHVSQDVMSCGCRFTSGGPYACLPPDKHPCKLGIEKKLCMSKEYHSENCLKQSVGNRYFKRRTSEPLRSVARLSSCKRVRKDCSESTIWPEFSRESSVKHCNCSCNTKVINPMLKIAHYFDSLLADIEDCNNT